jgi:hypothetical protein
MSDWVEILFTYDETDAQMIKDVLESENIEVSCRSLKITPYPVNIGRMGEVRLLVKSEDLESAKNILRVMSDTKNSEII